MAIPTLDELNLLHEQICQAVGDPKRIQILYALHDQPRPVTMLAVALGIPQPTVSRHLSLLRQRGIVFPERTGTTVIYRLVDDRVIQVLDIMREVLRDAVGRRTDALA